MSTRFGQDSEVGCWGLVEVTELNLGQDSEIGLAKLLSLSLVKILMFGWYLEVIASKFWNCLIKICGLTCDMNSTLGSVVPLAMFSQKPEWWDLSVIRIFFTKVWFYWTITIEWRNINIRKTPILIWLYEWFSDWLFWQELVTIENSFISKEVVAKQKKTLKATLPCSWRKVHLCFYFILTLFIWENDANGFHLRYCGKILQVVFSDIFRLRNVCKNTSIKIEATTKSKKIRAKFQITLST